MSINLTEVRWQNFLSTGNNVLAIKLDNALPTLICGTNGAGKSTVIDAVSYGLFNKPFRKINKPQLINTITNKNMVVEIDFTTNGHQYTIRRGIKPNLFEIYQNDHLLNQDAESKDYQQLLETSILKINHRTFCQIVVLGSANFTPFMQLTAAQRREVIEDLLDIQVFSTMNLLLKEQISNNKNQLTDNDHQIKMIENTIQINLQHQKQLEQQNQTLIEEKQKQIEQLLSENQRLSECINNKQSKIDLLQQQLGDRIVATRQSLEKATLLKSLTENKLTMIDKQISFFGTNDTCPTCEQQITEQFKHTKTEGLTERHTQQSNNLQQVLAKILRLQAKQQKLESNLQQLNQLLDQQRTIINKIASNNRTIDLLNTQIQQTNQVSTTVDIEQLQQQLQQLHQQRQQLLELRELQSVAQMLLKDGGIKSQIIKQYIPIINSRINHYLDQMEFFCQFTINESFEETIKSRYRDEFSYQSFSEGEKMRIDLALLFTWRDIARMRNSASINLLIMDEIMDSSLDQSGTDEFTKIISTLSGNNNVMIISHKHEQLTDKFANTIRFEKHKNFSKIIQ